MNREIMFRVFDTLVSEMVDTNMHVIGESFCCDRIEGWINEHREAKGDKTILERYNDMVLMQYTGLHDHTNWNELSEEEKGKWYNRQDDWKGKTIYEADILEVKDPWKGHLYIVEYGGKVGNYPSFDLKPILNREVNSLQDAFRYYSIRVVGNKFEDPQLLEETKND